MLQSKRNPATAREGEGLPCLSLDQLTAYAEKSLPAEQRAEVEVHLILCELCREAMEGMLAYSNASRVRELVEALNDDIRQRAAPQVETGESPSLITSSLAIAKGVIASVRNSFAAIFSWVTVPANNLRFAYVVATALVLGFVSVLYFNRERPHEALFAEYYQPYPNIASVVRGELREDELQNAMQQYDAGDFKAALKLLLGIIAARPDDMTAQFYAGVCYLKLEEPEKAMISLQKVIAQQDEKLAEPAEWYAALAYVQLNDLVQARALLQRLVAADRSYREPATKLLGRLSQ